MPAQPHNLKVGEKCWLIVGGDDKDLANCHKAEVTAISADGKSYTVTRPAWTDELMDLDNPPSFEEIEVSGLSHLEGVFTTKSVFKDEGNGKAALSQLDGDFPDSGFKDMVDMRRLNDAELARNLRLRSVKKEPYCRCGVTLVAINLYEPRESYAEGGSNYHIFSQATLNKFRQQKDRETADPHPWSLASHCYTEVFKKPKAPKTGKNDQSIIITGESGAGKTFTTMKILDYLAEVGGGGDGDDDERITDLMLSATPILEGFGNANMPRNPDSSRFGKLYKIFFDEKDKCVTGCTVTPYMLEKSRLSAQQMNERNFHIFYRMLADAVDCPANKVDKASRDAILFDGNKFGFSPEEKSRYHLEDFEHYVYLKGGTAALGQHYTRIYGDVEKGFMAIDGQVPYPEARTYDDAKKMSETKFALKKFFSDEQIDVIWRVTSGCLWLGNVDFTGDDDACDVDQSGPSGQALDMVSELWQVDVAALVQACNIETITIAGKDKPCKRGLGVSRTLRDSMARTVYDQLFVWMIAEMSRILSTKSGTCNVDRQPFIGVLDIFGFEFYADETLIPLGGQVMNTLDQYNINMCNEVLQGEFVRCIFDLEQDLYKTQLDREIEIDFEKNYDTIELMMGKKKSIIAEMDAEITKKHSGAQADKGFYAGLGKMIKDKNNKAAQKRLTMKNGTGRKTFANGGPYGYDPAIKNVPKDLAKETPGFFKLDHYAANVTYDVRDWVDKDLDKLSADSYKCLMSSGLCDYMVPVFTHLQANAANSTVARDFANSLKTLVDTLQGTDSNFVRCLKASNPLANNVFKNALVLNQLKYTGMLDTLVIRRGGFPVRMEFQDFCDQYRVLDVDAADSGARALAEAIQKQVPEVLDRLDEKPDEKQWDDAIAVGKPKKAGIPPLVLMRDWLGRELDTQANIIKARSAVICQAVVRMGFSRHTYLRAISARTIQSFARTVRLCKPFFAQRDMTMSVLPEARGLVARAISHKAAEINTSTSNKAAMVAFLEDNVSLQIREQAERRLATAEDEYSQQIAFARFEERIGEMKATHVRTAEDAYKKAMECVHVVNDVIDTMSAKSAEIDARWSKMQNEGVVRSVPLVRQDKALSSFARTKPDRSAYKFRFSFKYKGTAEVSKRTPDN